ncbi:MAG: NAD(P)/FAD-dependent oxidoreductase [Pseudomonadota bacterium]
MNADSGFNHYDVIIVGGGAAGVGVAVALRHAGINNFLILERYHIGASFASWPAETQFITPSFPTNSIGMLDLNSVAIGASPAYSLQVEHPTGQHFAEHLYDIAEYFQLPVREQSFVTRVTSDEEGFLIETSDATLRSKHVIWAAGEFQYPRRMAFPGSELCRHTSTIGSYDDVDSNDIIIIGGYESGIDAAYHLAYRDKLVRLFDSGCPWESTSSDPSITLSPFTLERMREDWFCEQVELHANTPVVSVSQRSTGYIVTAMDGREFHTEAQPLWAGGFEGSHMLIANLFALRDDGFPLLNEHDESTICPGVFLCGPAVRHENQVFCFIYKYRQRFAVVAKAIATSLGLAGEELETYRLWGMYLDDLSCCGEECVC